MVDLLQACIGAMDFSSLDILDNLLILMAVATIHMDIMVQFRVIEGIDFTMGRVVVNMEPNGLVANILPSFKDKQGWANNLADLPIIQADWDNLELMADWGNLELMVDWGIGYCLPNLLNIVRQFKDKGTEAGFVSWDIDQVGQRVFNQGTDFVAMDLEDNLDIGWAVGQRLESGIDWGVFKQDSESLEH